tara:strand:- start:823 stop:966 length:144 start_codon:yes stop_codon:yes gene_type:complete
MVEFIIAFFVAVAALEVTTEVAGKAYEYVEPKVTQMLSDEESDTVQE